MTRFRREISDSTRARQPYPEARCRPMRPLPARSVRGSAFHAAPGWAVFHGGTAAMLHIRDYAADAAAFEADTDTLRLAPLIGCEENHAIQATPDRRSAVSTGRHERVSSLCPPCATACRSVRSGTYAITCVSGTTQNVADEHR